MTKTKRYRYSGPLSGVTLREGKATREVMLIPGREVELPDNTYVRGLIARGHLTEVAAGAPAKTAKKAEKEE